MSGVIPERVIFLREKAGLSQSELARETGGGQSSINRLEAGDTRHPRNLNRIARYLGTTPEYLTGETDDPSSGLADDHSAFKGFPSEISDSVEVQEIDLAYGMGGTYLDDVPVKSNTVRFAREWLRNFTKAGADQLFFARGIGDSMMPTILDSDIMLIDRSQDSLRMNDQIWAVAFGGMGMIKRLRSMPDGSVRILSDNPAVPEDNAVDDELFIIGRVVAVVRKI